MAFLGEYQELEGFKFKKIFKAPAKIFKVAAKVVKPIAKIAKKVLPIALAPMTGGMSLLATKQSRKLVKKVVKTAISIPMGIVGAIIPRKKPSEPSPESMVPQSPVFTSEDITSPPPEGYYPTQPGLIQSPPTEMSPEGSEYGAGPGVDTEEVIMPGAPTQAGVLGKVGTTPILVVAGIAAVALGMYFMGGKQSDDS